MEKYLLRIRGESTIRGYQDMEEIYAYLRHLHDSQGKSDMTEHHPIGFYIYKVNDVISEVNQSNMDASNRESLLRQLENDVIQFELNMYPELNDVLENVDDVSYPVSF
ncbi:hypothetical protein [Bacillus sp. T33-2]|uniref:hypothetical protein n=1 Tax=Bacillus sp. T33-2 TaxID=2054168 RepID=UPI000C7842A4|nr:hypothetical protein [Bacillus sp. T33-2]PLR95118.1 hypothetical protein CVD19_15815 [Bacillus sp. T33-2]